MQQSLAGAPLTGSREFPAVPQQVTRSGCLRAQSAGRRSGLGGNDGDFLEPHAAQGEGEGQMQLRIGLSRA